MAREQVSREKTRYPYEPNNDSTVITVHGIRFQLVLAMVCFSSAISAWSQGYIFMLNSAEQEIYSAHKC